MRFLTVSSCCGFDLETGGLLIGFFELCATTMFFLSSNNSYSDDEYSFNDACTVINFFALFIWFIGIYKKHSGLMLFAVIWTIISLMYACGMMILFSVFVSLPSLYPEAFFGNMNTRWESNIEKDRLVDLINSGLMLLWIFASFIFVVQFYCTAVKFSLYKATKNNALNSSSEYKKFANAEQV